MLSPTDEANVPFPTIPKFCPCRYTRRNTNTSCLPLSYSPWPTPRAIVRRLRTVLRQPYTRCAKVRPRSYAHRRTKSFCKCHSIVKLSSTSRPLSYTSIRARWDSYPYHHRCRCSARSSPVTMQRLPSELRNAKWSSQFTSQEPFS